MKNMKVNDPQKELNIFQKIGLCLLAITVVSYYILSIQFLTS